MSSDLVIKFVRTKRKIRKWLKLLGFELNSLHASRHPLDCREADIQWTSSMKVDGRHLQIIYNQSSDRAAICFESYFDKPDNESMIHMPAEILEIGPDSTALLSVRLCFSSVPTTVSYRHPVWIIKILGSRLNI